MDAMLVTGLRPIEFFRMDKTWYRPSRRCLDLPEGACLKEKCQYKERTVLLSLYGCDVLDRWFEIPRKIPKKVSMRDTLRRYAESAGIGTDGITSKMFRKTWDSWLAACFPEQYLYIASSQGHDVETIRKYYMGIAFPPGETDKMTKYVGEWGKRL